MADVKLATGMPFESCPPRSGQWNPFLVSRAGQADHENQAIIQRPGMVRVCPDGRAPICWDENENPSWTIGSPKDRKSR
jgi:hypothetical protein